MKPAYHIPLSPAALRTMGEICAIQGQIEWLMRDSLALLLDIGRDEAGIILGSTSIGTNVDIWAKVVRAKCRDKRTLGHVTAVVKSVVTLAAGRNDFIHAFFAKQIAHVYEFPNGALVPLRGIGYAPQPMREPGRIVAIRTRGGKTTPISRVRFVRNAAAALSQRLLKVRHRVFELCANAQAEQRPSQHRLQLRLFSHRTKTKPRSGKARQRLPRSSPG